jgi:hypothetical protein
MNIAELKKIMLFFLEISVLVLKVNTLIALLINAKRKEFWTIIFFKYILLIKVTIFFKNNKEEIKRLLFIYGSKENHSSKYYNFIIDKTLMSLFFFYDSLECYEINN